MLRIWDSNRNKDRLRFGDFQSKRGLIDWLDVFQLPLLSKPATARPPIERLGSRNRRRIGTPSQNRALSHLPLLALHHIRSIYRLYSFSSDRFSYLFAPFPSSAEWLGLCPGQRHSLIAKGEEILRNEARASHSITLGELAGVWKLRVSLIARSQASVAGGMLHVSRLEIIGWRTLAVY
jgi:hypothetical protein